MTDWRRIHADGPTSARLVLIGEAGGENEHRLGRPFVGASGHKLNAWWHNVGLRRADFWIDNVFPFHPPGNDLAALLTSDYLLVHEWAANLHERIAALDDPWVIVPTGNVALRALMRRALDDTTVTISKYRGSIMEYVDPRGRAIKMIPTIHPASIYHQRAKKARGQEKSNPGRTEKHCVLDWQRIAREAQTREVAAPPETYHTAIEASDLAYWRAEFDALDPATPVTIDIETATGVVDCVGFAWSPEVGLCIPLRYNEYNDAHGHETFAARRALIEHLCTSPNPKVLQNGPFDIFWLARAEHIVVANYAYELMCLHHALDPVDDHDLGYMKSVFLRGEYHKDEAKSPDKSKKYASNADAYFTYNAMDCCAQIALYYALQERLMAADRWTLYETCYRPVLPHLIGMLLGGMNTSRLERRIANAELVAECVALQDRLAEHCGFPLHAKKDLSRTKIQQFLYEVLKLPPQRTRAKRGAPGKVTTNEVALRKLQLRFPPPHPGGVAIDMMLKHRRALKLSQFLSDQKTDDDGRLRSVVMPLTEAGRCSSAKNPFGTGTNLQNQDRDPRVRSSFIPDYPDHVFLELDCSQAESRIVYVLSGDDDLYQLARMNPDAFDTHSYNAHLIFGGSPVPTATHTKRVVDTNLTTVLGYVSYEQRYFGKRVEHGAQRGMGGETMADNLLKEDVIRTPEECARMLELYHRAKPGIERYFEWVRRQLLREKALTNSWGFRWDVRYEQMNQDLYRRAYSFLPQSEVAFLLNVWGVATVGEFIAAWYTPREARLVMQVHDSILVSCLADPDVIVSIAWCAFEHMTQPRAYLSRVGPRELSMPVECKVGPNWGFPESASGEWKRLPTRDEVAAVLNQRKAV